MSKAEEHKFKAVDFQRKRREALSELYNRNPEEFRKQLDIVRKKRT